jgi:excisionase family DNA binding protein
MSVPVMEEQAYKVRDVADILQINPRTVRKMIAQGELRAFKVRDEWRVWPHDLDVFISERFTQRDQEDDTG